MVQRRLPRVLVILVSALEGELSQMSLIGKISENCLPMWLSDQLCSKYRHDDMECPVTVNQYTQQMFDLVRESHLAWRFILEKVQSWDQIESGNELAELDLITRFLDFYELSVYYDVDKIFLNLKCWKVWLLKLRVSCWMKCKLPLEMMLLKIFA